MFDKNKLCEFLVEAKKATYAAGDSAKKIIEADWSSTLIFEKWELKYHDNYFWWEPYGGREVVFCKWKANYIMTYYWRVYEDVSDLKYVYKFLQEALANIPLDKPFRWPREYKKAQLTYINDFVWEIDNFSGEEKILKDGKEVYSAKYMGGLVDQSK
jgi:hypothetical protein